MNGYNDRYIDRERCKQAYLELVTRWTGFFSGSRYLALPTLENGRVDCAGNTHTGICTFTCFHGYDLHGPTMRWWTKDEQFNRMETSCEGLGRWKLGLRVEVEIGFEGRGGDWVGG